MNDKLLEIMEFWSYNGDSRDVDDIVSLREIAITDIHEVIKIIKRYEESNKSLQKMIEKEFTVSQDIVSKGAYGDKDNLEWWEGRLDAWKWCKEQLERGSD